MITVVFPSGILKTFRILATVPVVFISSIPGSSFPSTFCETTPIILFPLFVSFINLMDLSRPAVIGTTTPGNKTVFRRGKIGRISGNSSLSIASSSSKVIKGINSASSCRSCNDKLSSNVTFLLVI